MQQNLYTNKNSNPNPMTTKSKHYIVGYFMPGTNREANKRVNAEITEKIHIAFKDIFLGIWHFEGMFTLQVNSR